MEARQLERLRDKLADMKAEKSELIGQKKSVMANLKQFRCDTVKAAEKKLESIKSEKSKKEESFATSMGKLKESFDWD